jgi:hypothetical protein
MISTSLFFLTFLIPYSLLLFRNRLQLKDAFGNQIHKFESDCGNGQLNSFHVDKNALVNTTVSQLSVNIFPRMGSDYLSVYTTTNKTSTPKIRITRDGEYIEHHEYSNIKESVTEMNKEDLI